MKRAFSLLLVVLMIMTAFPAFAETSSDTLQNGSRGDAVLTLQQRLNELGYDAGTADGIFGKKTTYALAEFELLNGFLPTGIADRQLQELLLSEDAVAADGEAIEILTSPFTEYIDQRLTQHVPGVYGGPEFAITRSSNGPETLLIVFTPEKNYLSINYWVGNTCPLWFVDVTADNLADTLYAALRLVYELGDSVDYVAYVNDATYYCAGYRYANQGFNYSPNVKTMTVCPEGAIGAFMTLIVEDVLSTQTLPDDFSFASSIDWNADPNADATATPAPTVKPTATPKLTATPKPTTKSTTYSKADCKNIAINTLKSRLKNPASLQVHNVSIDGEDGDSTFAFEIDFSAQNSLGGYKRQTFFCIVNANTGFVSMVTII